MDERLTVVVQTKLTETQAKALDDLVEHLKENFSPKETRSSVIRYLIIKNIRK